NDPKKWRTGIPTYQKVEYKAVYPGIDLAYYANYGTLEYDLIVAPGADPSQIKLAFEGADSVEVDSNGDLVLTLSLPSPLEGEGQGEGDARSSTVRLQKPLVYQLDDKDHRTLVAGSYVVTIERPSSESELPVTRYMYPSIDIQYVTYDHSKHLNIDSMIIYYSYHG